MSGTITFFNPTDLAGILDASWEVQGSTPTTASERAATPKSTGDEATSKIYNPKTSYSVEAECPDEAELVLPIVGTVSATGWHLDGFSLALSATGWPRITLTIHKHAGAATHAAGGCRTYTPTLTITGGFGIDRTGLGFALAVGDTAIGFQSVGYSVECTHEDVTGDGGEWLAGENRDGVEKFNMTLTGSGATVTAPTDATHAWDLLSKAVPTSNTSADSESFEYEHHIELDAEA
jgi:hypothetical protein